ncbi:MAG: hypothetical protein M3137_00515 [Actinomycetota bacterium]|nr:hypothetical protein [Actinomycetota bacterium]
MAHRSRVGGWVMFHWFTGGLGKLFGFLGSAAGAVAGWAWDKVTTGIYTWLAQGLALLIEWVWGVLDRASTPHVTADWFSTGLVRPVGLLAVAVTIGLMLASVTQAALAGRPEQIGDAVKEGIRVIVASALTLSVIDVLIGITDESSAMVWRTGRSDLVNLLEKMTVVAATTGPLGHTFVGPLCLLVGFIGLIGLVVSLMMRSALIYVAAALAPLVWSTSVLPLFRGSARKLVHLLVSLILSKLAIVISLVVAVKLVGNAGVTADASGVVNDGAAAVGTLMSGFVCFLIAAVTPFVLYKLMPTVEGAIVGAGVAGGWGRSVTNAAHTAAMVKSMGTSAGASAATRGVAGQTGVPGNVSGSSPGPAAGLPNAAARPAPSPTALTTPGLGRDGPSGASTAATTPGPAASDTGSSSGRQHQTTPRKSPQVRSASAERSPDGEEGQS